MALQDQPAAAENHYVWCAILQFRAIFKGKQRVEFHERTIPERVVLQAFTLFFLATFYV